MRCQDRFIGQYRNLVNYGMEFNLRDPIDISFSTMSWSNISADNSKWLCDDANDYVILIVTYALYVVIRGFLDDDEVVAVPVHILEVDRRPAALELTVRDDGDAVSQNVCLVHVMRGE